MIHKMCNVNFDKANVILLKSSSSQPHILNNINIKTGLLDMWDAMK